MYIANPIYDVVFKYLMEDAKIAKLMISTIIGEEILELDFSSQEFVGEFESKPQKVKAKTKKQKSNDNLKDKIGLTVYRLDFTAKIKTKEGEKRVIFELQKAKFPTDIMRFRKYLGDQLSNKENTERVMVNGKSRKFGLPIISIYFLGHTLDHTKSSAIKVSRQYIDLITNELITVKENFIESLTIDSYVIQIPSLTAQRRNELEILLSVFDQSSAIDNEHHILNMDEADFPEKFHPIIRKLHQAVQSKEIKNNMELEDGIIDELEDMYRQIEELEEKNRRMKQEEEQAKLDKAKAEEGRAKAEEDRAKIEEDKAKIERENDELRKKIAELLANKKE
jgi:hypothetical protein